MPKSIGESQHICTHPRTKSRRQRAADRLQAKIDGKIPWNREPHQVKVTLVAGESRNYSDDEILAQYKAELANLAKKGITPNMKDNIPA